MNFGETIAYWYFRLNGFLLLTNFVVHRQRDLEDAVNDHRQRERRDADIDLLAVRFPHAFESIGGQPDDWDNERFVRWQLKHLDNTVCVICEVKAGSYAGVEVAKSFSNPRLDMALQRIGVLSRNMYANVLPDLRKNGIAWHGEFTFAKVLVADSDKCTSRARMPVCHQLELKDAVKFIRRRLRKYSDPKKATKMRFGDHLMQFLASEAGISVVDS